MVFVGTEIKNPWYQGFGQGTGGGGGGGAPTDAHYITSVGESGLSNEVVFGTSVFYAPNTLASRPGAGSTISGAIYFATDGGGSAGQGVLYRSDGVSTWTPIAIDKNYADALYGAGGFQPLDATLTALAGVTTAADKVIYATGADAFTTTDFSSLGRSIVGQTTTAGVRSTIGVVIGTDVQAFDAELAALAGLTSAADRLPYFTGSGTAALATFTTFGRSLVDDPDAATAQATLQLVPGTNVQAFDTELAALASTTSAADKVPYFTGSGTASTTTVTSFSRSLLDDVDAATWLSDLGLLTVVDGTKIDTTPSGSTLTIDVDLSEGKSGGDTLIGGTAASETMTIGSTSNTTRGLINLRDQVQIFTENKTNTAAARFDVLTVPSTTTITLADNAGGLNTGNQVAAYVFQPTIQFTNNAGLSNGLFLNNATYKNTLGSTPTFGGVMFSFGETMTFEADTQTLTLGNWISSTMQPTFTTINSGVLTVSNYVGYRSNLTTGNSSTTVTAATRIQINNATLNSGAVTTDIGIDIGTLSTAGTGIGIRNASRYVATPLVKTITATSDTIPNTAEVIRLNNTSGSSKTLASTPTIADGVDGQFLFLVNVSANDVVIQDGATLASSNIKLNTTQRTLQQRDCILLFFTTGINDWVEVAFSNNL